MARRPRSSQLETRTARFKLTPRKKPYGFVTIAPGIALAYRRNRGAGTWVVRVADGHGGNWTKGFGIADDHEEADGAHVLTFWQAQDKARVLARGDVDHGRPYTVNEALDAYAADLTARSGLAGNVSRVRYHLPPTLAAKTVSLLTSRELQRWRDSLSAKIKPASVNRLMHGFKAALNHAAKHDPRITNINVWKIGLAAIPDAHRARNMILNNDRVRDLIAAAYAEDSAFGLLVETGAVTGARPSQLSRLEVGDLQLDHPDGPRLQMPGSRKGRGHKRITRYPVPIPLSLAIRLRQAVGEREASAPLLLHANGQPWRTSNDYRRPFEHTAERAGLSPDVTFYALRHSSIVRALLAGVPVRVVAVAHGTSVTMIEGNYSAYISDHADAVLRRALFDPAQPPIDPINNVVALPERRP